MFTNISIDEDITLNKIYSRFKKNNKRNKKCVN